MSRKLINKGLQLIKTNEVLSTSNSLIATTTTGAPTAGYFHSTIVNRAALPDLSADNKVRMGTERIIAQQICQLQNESGPNGEPVWSVVNDTFGQIRLIGSGWSALKDTYGQRLFTGAVGDFVEITFYGTGLNVLLGADAQASRDFRVSVNGGTEGSNFFTATYNNVTHDKRFSPYPVFPLVSGLTLGVYTVKLRLAAVNMYLYGFEILNEASTLKVTTGGAYRAGLKMDSSATLQSLAYNSAFDSGTLGTRGGRVAVYQKVDGTVGKAVTPTNASTALGTSSDHTNEEIARSYHWREFTTGRADDFSICKALTNVNNPTFTLDDGVTTLTGSASIYTNNTSGGEAVGLGANGSWLSFTFVGTGLDLVLNDGVSGASDTYTYQIDGGSAQTWPYSVSSANTRVVKFASGLPYGTHTFKMNRVTAATYTPAIIFMNVYQPKTPAIPSGAIQLGSYNIMADTSITASTTNFLTVVSGALRKNISQREAVYVGTWGTTLDTTNFWSGWNTNTTTNNSYVQHTFFGTGCEFGFFLSNNASVFTFTFALAAGSGAFSSNLSTSNGSWPAIATSFIQPGSGASFTNTTGVVTGNQNAAGRAVLKITGLPLGTYTIKLTQNSTLISMIPDGLDIITPIHSNKSNLYADLQNTLPVGSNAISDDRAFAYNDYAPQKAWAQAIGILATSTTSTVPIPVPDMSCAVKTTGGPLKITWSMGNYCSSQGSNPAAGEVRIYVDGVQVGVPKSQYFFSITGQASPTSDFCIVPVAAGYHKVEIYWNSNNASNTINNNGTQRNLIVEEK